jgi:hypothetical protein
VTIPYGQTSAAFSVPILDDQQQDPNEGFRVVLTAPTNAVLTNSQGQPPASGQALAGVVIQDDHTTQTSGSCGSGKPTQQTFGDGSTRKETRHRLITPARG